MLQLASALVHRGRDPGELQGLADLVRPENLREALRFFLERAGDRSTRQIHALATHGLGHRPPLGAGGRRPGADAARADAPLRSGRCAG